jgi:hypothetical protein
MINEQLTDEEVLLLRKLARTKKAYDIEHELRMKAYVEKHLNKKWYEFWK